MLNRKQLEDVAKARICGGIAGVQVNDIAQTTLTTIDMLKRMEWITHDSRGIEFDKKYCPICQGRMEHKKNCELAALLKEVEG